VQRRPHWCWYYLVFGDAREDREYLGLAGYGFAGAASGTVAAFGKQTHFCRVSIYVVDR